MEKEGKSNREIASLLGKAPQTIHTEIKRGTVLQCLEKGRFKKVYSADYAQRLMKATQAIGQEIKFNQGTKGKDSPPIIIKSFLLK